MSSKESSSGKGKGGKKKTGKSKVKGSSDSTSSKSHTHSSKSPSYKSSEPQTMKSAPKSGNIFSHSRDDIVTEIVPVDCGSGESPFLSTFVASIRLQPADYEIISARKGSKKSRDEKMDIDVDASEDEGSERIEGGDLLFDDLSPGEQRDLEVTFRNVYNNLTYLDCDGFFRKVYSVSLTLVERDEEDEEYAVTLQNTYRVDGTDQVEMMVTNGTLAAKDGEMRRRLQMTNGTSGDSNSTGFFAPTKEEDPSKPTTYVQVISGGEDLPIYYVSLAATCRNCDVTDALNFPLLAVPEEDEYLSVSRIGSRQGGPVFTSTMVNSDADEDTCACPLPVEEKEEDIARRRLQQRRLDEHDLYFPPPSAPTSDEFVNAMNEAIRDMQEREGKLLRVAAIVDLIEPDYFQGEEPEQLQPPTPAPTVSAMPSVSPAPTLSPTVSPQPTITPEPTSEGGSDDVSDDMLMGNETFPPEDSNATDTTAPTTPPLTRRPTQAPTRRPTAPPTSQPTSAATMWVVSVWSMVVPLLLVLM